MFTRDFIHAYTPREPSDGQRLILRRQEGARVSHTLNALTLGQAAKTGFPTSRQKQVQRTLNPSDHFD